MQPMIIVILSLLSGKFKRNIFMLNKRLFGTQPPSRKPAAGATASTTSTTSFSRSLTPWADPSDPQWSPWTAVPPWVRSPWLSGPRPWPRWGWGLRTRIWTCSARKIFSRATSSSMKSLPGFERRLTELWKSLLSQYIISYILLERP